VTKFPASALSVLDRRFQYHISRTLPTSLPSFFPPYTHIRQKKMFSNVLRLARPVARLNAWSKPTTTTSRAFTVSTARKSGHPSPQLLGEGGKAGEVPTDINQSTGLERLQTLGYLEGIEIFDSQPLDSSRIGTLDNPVLVYSLVRSLSPFRRFLCGGGLTFENSFCAFQGY